MHKLGDRTMVSNYRPISLLCSVSKVLEKLVFDKTVDKLTDTQYGFLPNRSTLQQLLVFYENIFTGGRGSQWDVIYNLDFTKAFDSVSHGELLLKLYRLGIFGSLWNWFKSYL